MERSLADTKQAGQRLADPLHHGERACIGTLCSCQYTAAILDAADVTEVDGSASAQADRSVGELAQVAADRGVGRSDARQIAGTNYA